MNTHHREQLIETVQKREALRPLGRGARLLRDPLRAAPYYVLATLSHLRPFQLSFPTLWGTRMTSYLPEGNTFYYYGFCEANVTNFLIRQLREGMTFMDIGAHVGIYSMLGAALVGETGSVHSFEPTPWTFKLLQKNTKDLGVVTVNNQAVADTPSTLTFSDYGPGYGAYNSADQAAEAPNLRPPTQYTVASTSLDHYCREHTLTPDIIKIDAEGYEHHVLQGAKETLSPASQARPLVLIEVAGGEQWAENRQQSFSLLAKAGYIPYEMKPDGTTAPHELKSSYGYDNLVFIPQERITELTHTTV